MAVDDVYMLTVNATQLGSLRQNQLAFIATASTEPIAADFATIAAAIKEIHRPQQHPSVTYTNWRARQMAGIGVSWPDEGDDCSPVGGKYFEGNFSTSTTGAGNGVDALPPQCAFVTTLKTAQVGRSHRGRFYAGAWGEDTQVSGTWTTTLVTALTASWLAFTNTYTPLSPASGWKLGVFSTRIASGCRQLPGGGHERTGQGHPELAFTPVVSTLLRTTVFTQRRRVAGVGL